MSSVLRALGASETETAIEASLMCGASLNMFPDIARSRLLMNLDVPGNPSICGV